MAPVKILPGFSRRAPMHDLGAALIAGFLLLGIVAGGLTILMQIGGAS